DAAGAADPADVFRAPAEVPTCRTGSLRRAAADLAHRLRTAREILRSAAVLVSAAGRRARAERRRRRARTQYQRRLSTARDHPAADDDVPLMGFAERLATADPVRELPVHEPRYSHGARTVRSRLGLGGVASWPHSVPVEDDGRCGSAHGVDLECDRETSRG